MDQISRLPYRDSILAIRKDTTMNCVKKWPYYFFMSMSLGACAGHSNQPTADAANSTDDIPKIRNIILMIGDGMGPQQIGLLQDFAKYSKTSVYHNRGTALQMFADEGRMALSSTSPYGALVADSACSATQLATGKPALNGVIGLDAQGNTVQTILEKAKTLGKATGLITDTRITHATPAAFAAHQPHRSEENAIAVDMIQNDVDVLLGGGLRHWIPQHSSSDDAALIALINDPNFLINSKRIDNRNLLLEAESMDYTLAFTAQQLEKVTSGKLLGLFSSDAMIDGIAYSNCKAAGTCVEPSLAEMTKKALDLLSKNEDGFFLMVEGGQIDWAGHSNDAGDLLHQMIKFDESVQAVYDWVKDRTDTLVVITGDHETGGFSFSYSRNEIPEADSTIAGTGFSDTSSIYKPSFNFASPNVLDKLYAQKKDFYQIWHSAGGDFAGKEPTPSALKNEINNSTAFTVTLAEAKRILEHEDNHYRVDGHDDLAGEQFPRVDDFEEFYVYGEEVHLNLIARVLAKHQNTVWSTGTHTHTPVGVISWGPGTAHFEFNGLTNHVEIGSQLMKLLDK
jgi:alkaline phosphatase